jgi:hypothetical protein
MWVGGLERKSCRTTSTRTTVVETGPTKSATSVVTNSEGIRTETEMRMRREWGQLCCGRQLTDLPVLRNQNYTQSLLAVQNVTARMEKSEFSSSARCRSADG